MASPETTPKARLFVALDLPADARQAVVDWRARALGDERALRLVPPEALHVTLAFLGHLPETSIPDVEAAAFAGLQDLGPARLLATGARPIPPRRPRLFALDLDDPDGAAARVQAAVSGSLSGAGLYEPERRPFWPHVTLARVRAGERPPRLDPPPPPAEPFTAADVVLYRSRLARSGAAYEPLATHRLSG